MGLDNQGDIAYHTIMNTLTGVIDTNVLFAALRSRLGYSHQLLLSVGTGIFNIAVSVPLVMEYEAVTKRLIGQHDLTDDDIDDVLDFLCSVAIQQEIFYLWRPFLPDPKDDMILEVAVAAQCDFIVTYNRSHFRGIERFGVRSVEPREFLRIAGGNR